MFFFWTKKNRKDKDAELKAVKKDTFDKIDKATKSIKEVNKLLERPDVTLQIYYATRKKGKK